jgi:hypothetical protein
LNRWKIQSHPLRGQRGAPTASKVLATIIHILVKLWISSIQQAAKVDISKTSSFSFMPCDLLKSSESSNPIGNLGNRFHYGGKKNPSTRNAERYWNYLKVLENNVVKGGGTKRRKVGGHTKLCIKCKPASQDTQMCVSAVQTNQVGPHDSQPICTHHHGRHERPWWCQCGVLPLWLN